MRVNQRIERRVMKAAEHIALTGATVRQTAQMLGVSKSTVHKDMETRLKAMSPALYREVMRVFAVNKAQRHIRGGEATRIRYARLKEKHRHAAGGITDKVL